MLSDMNARIQEANNSFRYNGNPDEFLDHMLEDMEQMHFKLGNMMAHLREFKETITTEKREQ